MFQLQIAEEDTFLLSCILKWFISVDLEVFLSSNGKKQFGENCEKSNRVVAF